MSTTFGWKSNFFQLKHQIFHFFTYFTNNPTSFTISDEHLFHVIFLSLKNQNLIFKYGFSKTYVSCIILYEFILNSKLVYTIEV